MSVLHGKRCVAWFVKVQLTSLGLLFPQDATEKWVVNYNITSEVRKVIASDIEE